MLFRYALAILKIVEDKLLRQSDYMTLFSTFKSEVESLSDVKLLTKVKIVFDNIWPESHDNIQIAFHDLNPFPLRAVNNKREYHQKVIKVIYQWIS